MTTNNDDLTPAKLLAQPTVEQHDLCYTHTELAVAEGLAERYGLPVVLMANIVRDVGLASEAYEEAFGLSWPGQTMTVLLIDPDGTARLETIPCGTEGEPPVEFFALQMATGATRLVDRACGDDWLAVAKEDFDDHDDATGLPASNPVAESLIAKLGGRYGPVVGTVAFLGRDSDVRKATPSWMWRATPAWLISMAPPLADSVPTAP